MRQVKRLLTAAVVIAATASLAAHPAVAGSPSVEQGGRVASTTADAVPAQAPSQGPTASSNSQDKRAKTLRDKMPFFRIEPRLKGDVLIFAVDISPMREAGAKGSLLLDRVGGRLTISREGVNLFDPRVFSDGSSSGKVLLERDIPARLVKQAGLQRYRITLPSAVATSLRRVPPNLLAHRIRVVMHNEKDVSGKVTGYDRTQIAASFMPPSIGKYLASRRQAVAPCATCNQTSSAPVAEPAPTSQTAQPRKPPPNSTPGTMVISNGSPFDLSVAINNVQCITPYLANWSLSPGAVASNTSFEFFQTAEIAGNTFYTENLQQLQDAATQGMKSLESTALENLERAAFLKHITQSFARGLVYFGSSMFFTITLDTVAAAIAESNACTNAGSALNLTWTVTDVGDSQTSGNVDYWVPSYNRTGAMGNVRPTSISSPAPGSPLNAYNATSANGLAVSASQLQGQLGAGGSVTLSTLNSDQRNGSYYGFWCNYRNQQAPNTNSSSNVNYGASALGGGVSPDWGACNATSVTGSFDTLQNWYGISNASQLENEGYSVLIGYSTTSMATAGPHPALSPEAASSSGACLATNAPCIYTEAPTSATSDLIAGCTPGTWNMLTPWNGSSPSMNLSSPPSAYDASSTLTTQLAFTGFTASGTPVTDAIPASVGGTVTSSFAPSAVNPFALSPSDLTEIQNALGGPGGYVTDWLCVMTANTTLPSGIEQVAPSAVAMNLDWYGVPIVATAPNPQGNILSPPS